MPSTTSLARYSWVALGLAFVATWSSSVSSHAIAPLAPLIQAELGISKVEVGLFSSAIFVGTWGVLVIAGSLTDRRGVQSMLSLGQLAAGAVMLSILAAGNLLQAVAVMFVAGVGRATIGPGITKAVMDWFPPRARATAMGLQQTGVPVGGIVAASTLPTLGLAFGWRAAIAAAGLSIVAGGILTATLYRDPKQPGQGTGQRESMRVGVGEVLRNRKLWVISAVAFLCSAAQSALTTYMVLYFEEVVLISRVPDAPTRLIAAGVYLAVCQTGSFFARIVWGLVSDRVFGGRRLVVLAMVSGMAAMMSVVVGRLGPDYPLWLLTAIVLAYGATGLGWGGLYMAAAVETSGRRHAATGVGLSMTLMQGGTIGGAPLFGLVVDATGSYQAGWLTVAAILVGAALMSALGARGEKRIR